MTVYVDLLILSNFLLDYSLITYTGIIANARIKILRIIIATLFAVSGLVLFFIKIKILFFILRVLWGLIIIFIAFDFVSIKNFLKNNFIFYFLNYVVAGIIISYDFQFTHQAILVDFTNQTTWYLLIISFLFSIILTYIYKVVVEYNTRIKNTVVDVIFCFLNKEYHAKGLIDTGNLVTSLGDQIPVVFIDDDLLKIDINELYLEQNQIKYTYVIYKTIKNHHTTLAFKPDFFKVSIDHKMQEKDVYIAIVNNIKNKYDSYNVILNAKIFA